MIFNTLNTLIDDILLTIRNGHVANSENISRRQVEQWIHSYRALLIKQDLEKGFGIDQQYITTLQAQPLRMVSQSVGHGVQSRKCILETVNPLPKMVTFNHLFPVLGVFDIYGNQIQVGDKLKAKLQTQRKYTCNDYIAYVFGDHLRVDGPNLIDNVDIQIIAEDPCNECGSDDEPYPMPSEKIPALKELIFSKELSIRMQMPSDLENDARDGNTYEKPVRREQTKEPYTQPQPQQQR